MTEQPRQYPIACPACVHVTGYPFQVRTLPDPPGHVEIKLRCRDCGHEWVEAKSSLR